LYLLIGIRRRIEFSSFEKRQQIESQCGTAAARNYPSKSGRQFFFTVSPSEIAMRVGGVYAEAHHVKLADPVIYQVLVLTQNFQQRLTINCMQANL
jgi:hypothetical protein